MNFISHFPTLQLFFHCCHCRSSLSFKLKIWMPEQIDSAYSVHVVGAYFWHFIFKLHLFYHFCFVVHSFCSTCYSCERKIEYKLHFVVEKNWFILLNIKKKVVTSDSRFQNSYLFHSFLINKTKNNQRTVFLFFCLDLIFFSSSFHF